MKTETQIAEENIGDWVAEDSKEDRVSMHTAISFKALCEEHKQSCQRFLEFLEEDYVLWDKVTAKKYYQEFKDEGFEKVGEKIIDLKQTIKLYEEAGIK